MEIFIANTLQHLEPKYNQNQKEFIIVIIKYHFGTVDKFSSADLIIRIPLSYYGNSKKYL